MHAHPGEQLLLQDHAVTIAVHGGPCRQEVEGAAAGCARKAAPNHDLRRVLDGLDGVLGQVPAVAAAPPHVLSPGVHQAEGGLIREHCLLPISFRQVQVPPCEA